VKGTTFDPDHVPFTMMGGADEGELANRRGRKKPALLSGAMLSRRQ
jgi:hypothetical protein